MKKGKVQSNQNNADLLAIPNSAIPLIGKM